MTTLENLIIIGGGPAGLAAAIYAARGGINPLVIEGVPSGGQLMLTTAVENYPGFISILGPELIGKYRKQAETFGTRFITQNVLSVDFSTQQKKLTTSDNKVYQARTILITTGAEAKWIGLESEQKLRGKGVSACATCDGFFFKDKVVAVVGGGDTAMEEALVLTRFATKVYIVHRRNVFRASKIMQDRVLNHKKIEVVWEAEVVKIAGEDKVAGLVLTVKKNQKRELKLDGVFIAIGNTPATGFLKNSGVLLDKKGYVYTTQQVVLANARQQAQVLDNFDLRYQYATSAQGVFAAGDCVDYVYRQAGTAIGMGIGAQLEIERWLETAA